MDKRQKEIDRLVVTCLQEGLSGYAIDALKLGASKEMIKTFIENNPGLVNEAAKALKLTRSEIDSLVKYYLAQNDLYRAFLVIKELGASRQVIILLLKICLEKRKDQAAKFLAKLLTTKDEILIKVAKEYLSLSRRQGTKKEVFKEKIATLLEGAVRMGYINEVLVIIQISAENLTARDVDRLIKSSVGEIEKLPFIHLKSAIKIAALGASRRTLNDLLKRCLVFGKVSSSKRVARYLGRQLTNGETESLLRISLEKGFVDDARKAAELFGRELTISEIIRLRKHFEKPPFRTIKKI